MSNPIITITMQDGSVMKGELYPEIAPNTVNNFISLVKKGYYNGLIFHRVIPGFMIQGGCPDGTGMGGPGYSIKGEFSQNGFKNDLKHTKGVLSMARTMAPNSAGSQFFIMHQTSPHLDGAYAAFGKITAKIQATLRRAYDFSGKTALLEHDGAVLNLNDSSLRFQGQRIELTRNEFRILQTLMEQKGKIVSRDQLMTRLWQDDCYVEENTLTVNVTRLRKKLEAAGLENFITTKVGSGYIIE